MAYGPRMTSLAWLLLGVGGIAALVDWYAVARKDKRIEYVAKPATLLCLILVAVALDPEVNAMRSWFVVALALSMVGDVFLMLPGNLFVQGLGSFLLAHLAYIAGFVAGGIDEDFLVVATPLIAVAVIAVAVLMYARFLVVRMTGDAHPMRVPVALYAMVIGTMLISAVAATSVVAIAGAGLFVVSDGLIGYSRFIRMTSWAPLAIIVTYHLGQTGLVLALVFR
jgi:uncharacterized membrane protein YhhN